jgi:hypothetical protein
VTQNACELRLLQKADSPLWQVVLAHRGEDLNGDAVGEGAGAVGRAAGDAPAVAGLGEVGGVADGQLQVAGDEVAGLLVEVGVAGEEGALIEAEFGEEGVGAEGEGLLVDFGEDGVVAGGGGFWNMRNSRVKE